MYFLIFPPPCTLLSMTPKSPITYIARDIERALGTHPSLEYRIITNTTPYSEAVKNQYPEYITLIPAPASGKTLDTAELIDVASANPKISIAGDYLVFKNTTRIETAIRTAGGTLLNPSATLAETIENKISQIEWLGDLASYLPAHAITETRNIVWENKPFVLQWAHGHTGTSTILVSTEGELNTLKEKFPERMTRRTDFVRGPSFTVNAIVAGEHILIGNISYQITGILPFTDNIFTTIGNDWALTHSLLNEQEIEYIHEMVRKIGAKMSASGWKGLFGIYIIRNDETNTINLIEINARQPASTTFESTLQEVNRTHGVKGLTIFEAHLKAVRGEAIDDELIIINDGAQIIQRITQKMLSINQTTIDQLVGAGYLVIPYTNTEVGEDCIRIQSMRGIMETHGRFDKRGKQVLGILTGVPVEEEAVNPLDEEIE